MKGQTGSENGSVRKENAMMAAITAAMIFIYSIIMFFTNIQKNNGFFNFNVLKNFNDSKKRGTENIFPRMFQH